MTSEQNKDTWLDRMHEIADSLDAKSDLCRFKARALREVGMYRLARDLDDISNELTGEAHALRLLVSEKLTEQIKDAENCTATVFGAVLAGIKVSKESGESCR